MSVSKFVQPNHTTQGAADYKASIDSSVNVISKVGIDWAPQENNTPNMTVIIKPGRLLIGAVYVVKQTQQTTTITAPTTNPRIDRIAIDPTTGDYVIITGVEAASPVAPDYSTGHIPVCQFTLQTTTTEITNLLITDERVLHYLGSAGGGGGPVVSGFNQSETTYVESSAAALSNTLNLATSLVTNWRHIGPTGSGASVIWTALDGIPLEATWIELKFRIIISSTNVGDRVTYSIHGADSSKSEATSAANTYEQLVSLFHYNLLGANDTNGGHAIVSHKLPLDSANVFSLKRGLSGVVGTITYSTIASVVGFGI